MKKSSFFKYIVVVILGVVTIDVVFRLVFTPIFKNPSLNTKAGCTYKFIAYKEPANIIILGASKANHHYRCEQIEDSLGVSVYNYGWDGRCILYQYLCLLQGIKNGGLETVILDLSASQLSKEWVDERISDLYPYYWEDDTVRMIVDEVENRNMSILLLSSLIQYNSQYLNLIAPISSIKGYTPLAYTGRELDVSKIELGVFDVKNYSDIAEKYLIRMSSLCKERKLRFIVCLSPTLSMSQGDERYIEKICEDNEIECWNLRHTIRELIFFRDYNHLNDEGAKLFTAEVIKKMVAKK